MSRWVLAWPLLLVLSASLLTPPVTATKEAEPYIPDIIYTGNTTRFMVGAEGRAAVDVVLSNGAPSPIPDCIDENRAAYLMHNDRYTCMEYGRMDIWTYGRMHGQSHPPLLLTNNSRAYTYTHAHTYTYVQGRAARYPSDHLQHRGDRNGQRWQWQWQQ